MVKSTELGSKVVLLWAAAKLRMSEVKRKVKDSIVVALFYDWLETWMEGIGECLMSI